MKLKKSVNLLLSFCVLPVIVSASFRGGQQDKASSVKEIPPSMAGGCLLYLRNFIF